MATANNTVTTLLEQGKSVRQQLSAWSSSTHVYDTLLSELVKTFISKQEEQRKKYYGPLQTLYDSIIYSQLLDEMEHERIQTGLRQVDDYSTPASFRENTEARFVELNLPVLRSMVFSENEDETAQWIRRCYEENRDGTKQLLQNLYNDFLVADKFHEKAIVSLLRLFAEFDYEEMTPIGLITLSSAISLRSDKIKSVVLDVLGHWENRETYNLLLKLDPPAGFLYKIQYKALLKSFEEKYGVHAEDR